MTLLRELDRYKKQLRRQSTIRIWGGANNREFESECDEDNEDDDEDDEDDKADSNNSNGDCGPAIATSIVVMFYFQKRLLWLRSV